MDITLSLIQVCYPFTGLYIAFYLCVMACYSVMSVPYNGLIADLTPPFQRGTMHAFLFSSWFKHLQSVDYKYIYVRVSIYVILHKFYSLLNIIRQELL